MHALAQGSRCLEKGHQHRARPDRRETGQFVDLSSTDRNPADVLTKPKSVSDMEDKVNALGGNIVPRNVWRIMSVTRRQRWG